MNTRSSVRNSSRSSSNNNIGRCVSDYLCSHCSSVSTSFNQVIYRLFYLICAANNIIKLKATVHNGQGFYSFFSLSLSLPPHIQSFFYSLYFFLLFSLIFWTHIDWSQQLQFVFVVHFGRFVHLFKKKKSRKYVTFCYLWFSLLAAISSHTSK